MEAVAGIDSRPQLLSTSDESRTRRIEGQGGCLPGCPYAGAESVWEEDRELAGLADTRCCRGYDRLVG